MGRQGALTALTAPTRLILMTRRLGNWDPEKFFFLAISRFICFPEKPAGKFRKRKRAVRTIYVTVQHRSIGGIAIIDINPWISISCAIDRPCRADYHLAEMQIAPKVRSTL